MSSARAGNWRHEQRWPQQELIFHSVAVRIVGKFPEQRTHDRRAVVRRFVKQIVEIRQELVTEADVTAADVLDFLAKRPRFLPACVDGRVIAEKREERAGLCPAREEFARAIASEPADIRPAKWDAREAEVEAFGDAARDGGQRGLYANLHAE